MSEDLRSLRGKLADSEDSPITSEGEVRNDNWRSKAPDTYRHIFRVGETIPMAANPPDDRSEGSLIPGQESTSYNVRRNANTSMVALAGDYALWATRVSDNFFHALPTPVAADPKLYIRDPYFAGFQLAGPDPMMLRRVGDASELPDLFWRGSDTQQVNQYKNAMAEGRVYQTDFRRYAHIYSSEHFVSWPCAVFIQAKNAVFQGHPYNVLNPVGIVLDHGTSSVAAFTSRGGHPGYPNWQTAKRVFLTAAANYHELGTHLARTHLVMERYALATYRQLPPWHPVGRLLRPHFKFMVATNYDAVNNLINPGGPVDLNFYTKVDDLLKITKDAFATWDLRKHGSIEEDLRDRGLDDPDLLPFFPYRDQGLPIYRAIKDFVESYLGLWYASEYAVAQDKALLRWNNAIRTDYRASPAATPLTDKPLLNELITACTNIIWTCGPQHSAVNYPQYAFLADARTLPFQLQGNWPDMSQGRPGLFDTPRDRIRDQAAVITRLSTFRYDQLGQYKPEPGDLSEYGDLGAPGKPWTPVVLAFQQALEETSKNQRPFPEDQGATKDVTNPSWRYDYLKYSNIINAISI
jgi:arachidonate 15-lipoxygenase